MMWYNISRIKYPMSVVIVLPLRTPMPISPAPPMWTWPTPQPTGDYTPPFGPPPIYVMPPVWTRPDMPSIQPEPVFRRAVEPGHRRLEDMTSIQPVHGNAPPPPQTTPPQPEPVKPTLPPPSSPLQPKPVKPIPPKQPTAWDYNRGIEV